MLSQKLRELRSQEVPGALRITDTEREPIVRGGPGAHNDFPMPGTPNSPGCEEMCGIQEAGAPRGSGHFTVAQAPLRPIKLVPSPRALIPAILVDGHHRRGCIDDRGPPPQHFPDQPQVPRETPGANERRTRRTFGGTRSTQSHRTSDGVVGGMSDGL